jgi:pimeloyl-ACP methyl ester carboxylesterase
MHRSSSTVALLAALGPPLPRARLALVLGLALCLAPLGCASSKMVTLREVPNNPLVNELQLTSRSGPQPSDRTLQFLRVNGLSEDVGGDPRKLLDKVQAIIEREPSADKIYTFAELSYLAACKAEKQDRQLALDLYGASVVHAYQYLFDRRFRYLRNPYDPHFRSACDLYNSALEAGLRIVCKKDGLVPGKTYTIQTASGNWDFRCEIRSDRWRQEDFGRFEFVSDYEIRGLKNHYRNYGLGVPLIAVRRSYPGEPVAAKYYPEGLSFPVTAFLRPSLEEGPDEANQTARHQGILELYDPLATSDVVVDGLNVPLESDLTTPLAYFLSNPAMSNLANDGLLDPEKLLKIQPGPRETLSGLYMVQPYQPGKIPVLLVHGLWSSPMTWMEMFNDLRSCPEIREHYQFWFYLYPTAQPFWISAMQMRQHLAEVRQVLDPERKEPALDQMVLVGHSMGGLVSRLQTIESGGDFWKLVSDKPIEMIKADPVVRQRLETCFFFHPNPSIRRVVTIGTPHRGSRYSNDLTQWLSAKLISVPQMLGQSQDALFRENRDLLRPDSVLKVLNSIDSLSPASPFFSAMLASYRAPWVSYHNIIGMVPKKGLFGSLAAGTDGVVSYESAHVDDAKSELIVPADHTTVHSHPWAVLEVRRILFEHLAELRGVPAEDLMAARPVATEVPPPSSL